MHTTDTQKLIVQTALAMAGAPVQEERDDRLVEQVAQAMLIIEAAGLQSYILKGFKWSCASRGVDTFEVQRSEEDLALSADQLRFNVHHARGAAARRIRANWLRRYRAMGQEPEAINWNDQPQWRALQDRREARRLDHLYGPQGVAA